MKLSLILLIVALSAVVLGGIVPLSTINPNDIFRQVKFNPLNTLSYAEPEVDVEITELTIGYHAIAYLRIKTLYPAFSVLPVHRCRYATLGLIRFYTFTFQINGEGHDAKTAIQTNQTQTTTAENSPDQKEGFLRISVDWALRDPRISIALNTVIRRNWVIIGGNPLNDCWSKPVGGLFVYRFYFKGVVERFEFKQNSSENGTEAVAKDYFADVAPVFSVGDGNTTGYLNILAQEFFKHPAYPAIYKLLEQEFGTFNKDWIIRVQGIVAKDSASDSFKIFLNFQPFLLKRTYEAYYYGSIEKAALLKVDESVFSDGKSFENWQSIEDFNKYHAFTEAHQYILSQFTWLRFYKVVSAYSALHKKGRFVRLVYQGIPEQNIDAGNQINIIAYIDPSGKYYIDRNDFLATNLDSFGRNNWVSLFVSTPDVTKAQYYMRIVNFFKSIYPKFWSANQLEDIQFKDGLHVIKFRNPTNLCYSVLNIDEKDTKVLNRVNWTLLGNSSPLIGRLENYVRGKQSVSKIMFIQYLNSDNGTHFEVSFLDKNNQYSACYVLYIQETDVFTDDNSFHFQRITFSKDPLPEDVKTSVQIYLKEHDETILAVVSFVSLSPTSFAVIGISESGRWQITLEWQEGQWVVVSKQPYTEGYSRAHGYPSSSVASCTGFLYRLYPANFGQGWLYASIETKAVGVNLYTRLVYQLGDKFAEAIVGQTYGVDNSHILYSWSFLSALRVKSDYGYGKDYSFFYNLDKSYFYKDQSAPKPNLSVQPETPKESPKPASAHQSCPPFTRREIFTGQCIVVF